MFLIMEFTKFKQFPILPEVAIVQKIDLTWHQNLVQITLGIVSSNLVFSKPTAMTQRRHFATEQITNACYVTGKK